MACFIIQRMLQQKQLERKDLVRAETARKDKKESLDDFELLQQHEEVIQEDISEHYQQDFDSVSNDSHREEEHQIKEEFIDIEDNSQECLQRSKQENMREKEERERLEDSCRKMQLEISLINEQIQNHNKEESTIEELQAAVSEQRKTIQELEQERASIFQNRVGKDSFSLPFILADQDFQERLMQEIDKIKQMITLSSLQIGRIKRQTKKYEEMLPLQETNREEFYQKYKKLKKEVEDKREKCEIKQVKESELDAKLAKLKERLSQIEGMPIDDDSKKEEMQRNLCSRSQELVKKKEAELKKNTLLTHQLQGNCQAIIKNIQDLRRQSAELQQKIEALTKRNALLQQGSSIMMEKYKQNRSRLYKDKPDINDSNAEQSPPSDFKMPSQQNRRKKYYSQTKNPFTANMLNPDMLNDVQPAPIAKDRYIFKLKHQKSTPQSSTKENIKEELNQSSTSNTIKQFKLRLPNSTPKKSAKNLNVSLDITKGTPPKTKPKADLSKLSITQRLERIELLERQDRIYSHKLYDIKKKEEETVRKQAASAFAHSKEFSSADQLQLYQKQMAKDNEALFDSNNNLSSMSTKPTRSLDNPPSQIPTQSTQQSANIVIPQLTDRLHHNFFKKRIIHRQKKISEEYMKVLQQRGRRILQLDNESES